MNYNASQVGVPFVRAYNIRIAYPDNGILPSVVIEQALAVKLADGTIRKIEDLAPINASIDLANDGNDPIPLVSPEDGSALGANTSLNQTFLAVLAVVRSKQLIAEGG